MTQHTLLSLASHGEGRWGESRNKMLLLVALLSELAAFFVVIAVPLHQSFSALASLTFGPDNLLFLGLPEPV